MIADTDDWFLKKYMYLLAIFNESKDSNHITTIMTCLDTRPCFVQKMLIFKTAKASYIPLNFFFYLRKYLLNKN